MTTTPNPTHVRTLTITERISRAYWERKHTRRLRAYLNAAARADAAMYYGPEPELEGPESEFDPYDEDTTR